MHVLYAIDSLVPAGTERSLAALAPRYVQRGVQLDVAYLHERAGLHEELAEAGAHLVSLAGPGGRVGTISRALSLVRERRPDLVHTTLFEADVAGRVAAKLRGVPVVSTLTGLRYGPEHLASPGLTPWKVRSAQALDALTARLACRLHAVSGAVADAMARRLRYPRPRIDVVHRGRDPETLGRRSPERRAQARRNLDVGADTRVLLSLARQDHVKGLDTLVAALARVRAKASDVRLFVAGRDGGQTPALAEQVRQQGLTDVVTFLGVRSDVAELLCAADTFVLPSRREGMPGSLLEAMALELPIVASDLPQIREVADERHALLVPPDQPESLAAAITAVLSEPAPARERAERARQRFLENFTIGRVADEMLSFYDRALGRSDRVHILDAERSS